MTIAGCATKSLTHSEQKLALNQDKANLAAHIDDNQPDWFLNPPKEATGIYGIGTAYSENPQFALDKAKMHAFEDIASTYAQKVSSLKTSSRTEYAGSSAQATGKDSKTIDILVDSADLTGAVIKEADSFLEREGRRVYVLAYLPLGELNFVKEEKQLILERSKLKNQSSLPQDKLLERIQNKSPITINNP